MSLVIFIISTMKSLTFLISVLIILGNTDGLYVRLKHCLPGWTTYRNRCFLYVPARLSWSRAEKFCLGMHANLASVHSYPEQLAIKSMIAKATHTKLNTWLGGTDCQQEGAWLWSDGTSFNYHYKQLFYKSGKNQHCLHIKYGSFNIWNNVRCSYPLPFVCAKKRRRYG